MIGILVKKVDSIRDDIFRIFAINISNMSGFLQVKDGQ